MKRTLAIFAAALMTTAIAGAPALAQSNSGSGSMNGSMDANAPENTGGGQTNNTDQMKMQSSGQMGAADAMSMDEIATKLETVDVSTVKVIKTSDMANTDRTTTDAMPPVDTTPEEQAALQAAIEANADLTSKLEEKAVAPSDVVAANIDANNKVTVYVE